MKSVTAASQRSGPADVTTNEATSNLETRALQQIAQASELSNTAAAAVAAVPEAHGIHAENVQKVVGMSVADRQEALLEIESRLSPAALEFLKKRSSVRQQHQPQPQPLPPPQQQQQRPFRTPSASTPAGHASASSTLKPSASGRTQATMTPQQQQQADSCEALVARLRFGLDGEPVGLCGENEPSTSGAQVLLRDPLSRDMGAVADGYTLRELQVMARSSHAPQRAAALHMLAGVLRRARPSVCGVTAELKVRPRSIVLPPEVNAR